MSTNHESLAADEAQLVSQGFRDDDPPRRVDGRLHRSRRYVLSERRATRTTMTTRSPSWIW
jgi:hypothetical protein